MGGRSALFLGELRGDGNPGAGRVPRVTTTLRHVACAAREVSTPRRESAIEGAMPLLPVAVLAALAGLAEALAVSPSGHDVVARLWIEPGVGHAPFAAAAQIGAGVGLLAASRRRAWEALRDGVRAVARPALFTASQGAADALSLGVSTATSLLVGAATLPRVEMWSASPTATGVGLCVTGLSLASLALVPRLGPRQGRARPTLAGAAVAGIAHGIAVFPGASRVAAALVVLVWMGVRPARAVDLAFLLTVPALALAVARALPLGLGAGVLTVAALSSFLGAACASEGLRALVERRRVVALALWIVPLGLATLAYARALPHPL
jgi:undecaprenyl-diphosphatase